LKARPAWIIDSRSPVLVQVDEKVEAPAQPQLVVQIEIGVNFEIAAAARLVQPAAEIIWIRNKAVDAAHFLEKNSASACCSTLQAAPGYSGF
jgi:hypothetical protein